MKPRGRKSRRNRRVANLIRQVVSETLVTEIADPRVGIVTVTEVDLAPDFRYADVGVSVLGDERQQKACLRAIRHAHGHLQEQVANALVMKFCPVLRFHLDESVKKSVSMGALIARARSEDKAARAERIARGVEEPEEGAPDAGDEDSHPEDAPEPPA